MTPKQVSSKKIYKDELLSYLDDVPEELKQDIINQCVNYMILFSANQTIESSAKNETDRVEERQEFDNKTQESLATLATLLHPYTDKQLKILVQELEGKTDPYAEPDEVYELPKELNELIEQASQIYQQRQANIIAELDNYLDK